MINIYRWLFWIGLIFFVLSCVPQYSVKRESTKKQIYIWQEGDSLEKVSAKFGDSVLAIRRRKSYLRTRGSVRRIQTGSHPAKNLTAKSKKKIKT